MFRSPNHEQKAYQFQYAFGTKPNPIVDNGTFGIDLRQDYNGTKGSYVPNLLWKSMGVRHISGLCAYWKSPTVCLGWTESLEFPKQHENMCLATWSWSHFQPIFVVLDIWRPPNHTLCCSHRWQQQTWAGSCDYCSLHCPDGHLPPHCQRAGGEKTTPLHIAQKSSLSSSPFKGLFFSKQKEYRMCFYVWLKIPYSCLLRIQAACK